MRTRTSRTQRSAVHRNIFGSYPPHRNNTSPGGSSVGSMSVRVYRYVQVRDTNEYEYVLVLYHGFLFLWADIFFKKCSGIPLFLLLRSVSKLARRRDTYIPGDMRSMMSLHSSIYVGTFSCLLLVYNMICTSVCEKVKASTWPEATRVLAHRALHVAKYLVRVMYDIIRTWYLVPV